MKLKKFEDSDCRLLYFSPEINHGDFPFRFALEIKYTDCWSEEWKQEVGTYYATLLAVSPVAAGEKNCKSAAEYMGVTYEYFVALDDECQAQILIDYGVSVPLWSEGGNNLRKLMKFAHQELQKVDMLFGFYMDKPVNRIGATGWDAIRGDLLAPLKQLSKNNISLDDD